ncbi:MAG: C25 family cysteine peptidase, partial [Pseudomonadota bacterium]
VTSGFADGNIPDGSTNFQAVLTFNPAARIPNNNVPSVARLRLTTDPAFFSDATPPSHLGEALDGEIQDHFIPINTLPVTLAGFEAARVSPDRIDVSWIVATEAGTLGYRVYQDLGAKGTQRVSSGLIPAQAGNSIEALEYSIQIASESNGPLILEEVSNAGRTDRFGPFELDSGFGARPDVEAQPWEVLAQELQAAEQVAQAELRSRGGQDLGVEFRVDVTGIQRIPLEELQSLGFPLMGLDPAVLRLHQNDHEVALWVDGDGTLSAGNHLLFHGQALTDSLYSNERPYVLDLGGGQRRWSTQSAPSFADHSVDRVRHSFRLDEDRFYSFASPTDDPWYFDGLRRTSPVPVSKQWPLVLTSSPEGESRLTIDVWGGLDYPGEADDHRFEVRFNDVLLGERSFDGLKAARFNFSLGDQLLKAGTNQIEIRLLDTGFFADVFRIESIVVDAVVPVDASLAAEGLAVDRLNYRFDGISLLSFEQVDQPVQCGRACEQIAIPDLSGPDLIAVLIADNEVRRFVDYPLISDGRGRFDAILPMGPLYAAADNVSSIEEQIIVIETADAKRPEATLVVEPAHPLTGDRADLVAIAPQRFLDNIEPLLQARRAEGITARAIDVDDLYRHYNGGVTDPEAIRDFLQDVESLWATRYVILVGGDSYDYFDRLNLGSVSDVPTFYGQVHNVVRHAPLDHRFADLDDDGDAELAVGRLPVRTEAELDRLVNRILNHDLGPVPSMTFAAERSSPAEGSDYSGEVDQIISQLAPDWQSGVDRVFLDDYPTGSAGTSQARSDLVQSIEGGADMVSYFGHGAPTIWSRELLLQSSQIGDLLAGSSHFPIVTEFGCWGGYFVAPQFNAMSHGWMSSEDGGAVAMMASSGLTEHSSDYAMAISLLPRLQQPGVRLGDAFIDAKADLMQYGTQYQDIVRGLTLFGDPSMPVSQ